MSFPRCGTAPSLAYFRNLQGHEPIDDLPTVRGLDYSLQLSFGISNFCDHWEGHTDAQPPEEVTAFCRFDRQVGADHQEALATSRSAVDPESLVKYLEVELKRQSR